MRNTDRRGMAGSFAFVAALISLALTAMPTLADTEMGHTGLVGNHVVFDGTQDGFFGVVCHYRSNNHNKLNNIAVSAPDVYARDVTGSTDSQRVGWRIIVKRLRPGATVMKTFYRSEIWRATASDSTPAVFANAGSPGSHPWQAAYPLNVPREPGAGSAYIVFVKMYWYRHGALEGTATHRLDDYMWVNYPPGDYGFNDTSCHTRIIY